MEAEAMDGDGGREGEVEGNARIDPFLQPPILKAFFEVLPAEDLARCRLVCKLWKKESLSTWRSNATLNFGKEGIVSTRDDGSTSITSLEDFCDLWDARDWGSCPFRKLKLNWWKFKAGNGEQRRFLELMGCHITSLTLARCSFDGRENFRRIIYQAFPKLQFLKMDWCGVENRARTEEILAYQEPTFGVHGLSSLEISCAHNRLPESMMDMLSHFHKIKSLNLSGVDLSYRNLLEIIRLIRAQDQTKLPLKNFDFHLVGSGAHPQSTRSAIELVKLHEQLNLPLQHLHIYFDPVEDVDLNFNDVIRAILQNHSSTLKDLEFSGEEGLCSSFPFAELVTLSYSGNQLCPFGFCLENLKSLATRSPCFTDNLNYLRYTPNLRFLALGVGVRSLTMAESNKLFSNSTQLEVEDWTLPTLTELALGHPLSHRNLGKLMKWMPNVEHLYMDELDDGKFSMICENWRKLKYFMDFGEELTDAGVIGRENAPETGGGEEIQSCPSITKLENLTTFYTGSSKLTSASVREGFLKLDNLEYLALLRSTKIDHEGKAALEKRPKLRLFINPQNTCRDYMYYFKLASISLLATGAGYVLGLYLN